MGSDKLVCTSIKCSAPPFRRDLEVAADKLEADFLNRLTGGEAPPSVYL